MLTCDVASSTLKPINQNDLAHMSSQRIVPIFSGGGTRLPAHVGILKALNELDIGFSTLVGVSGGSIVAALYAKGESIEDMLDLAVNTDFRQFKDYSILRLLRHGGLSSGLKFEKWMDTQMDGMTFADLPKDLHIVATDVNGGGPVVFSKEKSPEMKVSKAVRYSMSIPLIFSFEVYRQHLLVDGAILSEDALFTDWQGDGTPSICFRLKSELREKPLDTSRRFMLAQYIGLLIRTFMTALSREYVHQNYWYNTLVINTGASSAVDFQMEDEEKMWLFDKGYYTVKEFLPAKLEKLTAPKVELAIE